MHDRDEQRRRKGEKVRVPFRRNRQARKRVTDLTQEARDSPDHEIDAQRSESVVAKGALSRQRTIIEPSESDVPDADLRRGIIVAVRGLFADVDDGSRVWACTVRRVLRTRVIDDRHPVTVGDRVGFRAGKDTEGATAEGVIESVEPRKGQLQRIAGRRVQTIAVNVDQSVIVSSAAEPDPKPHLIDRYIVSASAGQIAPIICMNKIDLDADGTAAFILDRYEAIGYRTLRASAESGEGIETLRGVLKDKESVIVGQSGVGKSSLLNAVQPGLGLKTAKVQELSSKGRHTTTTASLIRLDFGGYVVDTPGIRSFDLGIVPKGELEAYFIEFVDLVAQCRFRNCTHTFEDECAIRRAVEAGTIHPDRYDTYFGLYQEALERERDR